MAKIKQFFILSDAAVIVYESQQGLVGFVVYSSDQVRSIVLERLEPDQRDLVVEQLSQVFQHQSGLNQSKIALPTCELNQFEARYLMKTILRYFRYMGSSTESSFHAVMSRLALDTPDTPKPFELALFGPRSRPLVSVGIYFPNDEHQLMIGNSIEDVVNYLHACDTDMTQEVKARIRKLKDGGLPQRVESSSPKYFFGNVPSIINASSLIGERLAMN